MFLDRVAHFGKNLRDQGKCRSQKKLKSLIEVHYVVHMKVHVLGSYTEKAKIVYRGSLSSAHESTASNLQPEPFPFTVVHFGKNLGNQVKVIHQKTYNR